ncbi:MAG: flavin prenyltransferase UbiX [Thermoleophilia bacterium]|jgi:4-hydroxy-3-polyprenylbenzoate decarboxylase
MKIFVGISGASGSILGGRLLKVLSQAGHDVTVCVSDGAVQVMRFEDQSDVPGSGNTSRETVIDSFLAANGVEAGSIRLVSPENMGEAFASGSFLGDAAVICPCSMSTVAGIAAGITSNLIHRVADVMLKESRPLVVVPRETPLSEIHLRNMLTLRRAGAHIVPAMPAFYIHPASVDDLVDFVVGKVLDVLGISHELFDRWEGKA